MSQWHQRQTFDLEDKEYASFSAKSFETALVETDARWKFSLGASKIQLIYAVFIDVY